MIIPHNIPVSRFGRKARPVGGRTHPAAGCGSLKKRGRSRRVAPTRSKLFFLPELCDIRTSRASLILAANTVEFCMCHGSQPLPPLRIPPVPALPACPPAPERRGNARIADILCPGNRLKGNKPRIGIQFPDFSHKLFNTVHLQHTDMQAKNNLFSGVLRFQLAAFSVFRFQRGSINASADQFDTEAFSYIKILSSTVTSPAIPRKNFPISFIIHIGIKSLVSKKSEVSGKFSI